MAKLVSALEPKGFELWTQGSTTKEISEVLGVSISTVETWRRKWRKEKGFPKYCYPSHPQHPANQKSA